MQRLRSKGEGPFRFGRRELANTLGWKGLAWSIGVATVAWGLTEVVPYLEGEGGFAATAAAVLTVLLRGASEWLRDNEHLSR